MLRDEKFYYPFYVEKIGFIVISLIAVFLSGKGFLYDEPYYVSNIDIIQQYGLSLEYLRNLKGPPGPTHSVLHYLLLPITNKHIIPVRLVNPILFAASVWMLNRSFKQLGLRSIAMTGICIPMSAVCMGMALTEMPAIFFLCAGIYFFTIPATAARSILFKIISGLLISVAIIGRQPILLCFPFFVYLNGFSRAKLLENIIFLVMALALPAYCFFIWKGIIPPYGNVVEKGNIVFIHFIFALGYALLCFLFIAPAFLKLPFRVKPIWVIGLIVVLFFVSVATGQQFRIMDTLASRILPSFIQKYYPFMGFAILMTAAFYFVIVLGYRLYEHRNNKFFVFALLSCGAILCASLSIKHQFSSRYVFQAFPFILIMAEPYVKISPLNNFQRALGICFGVASLLTYLL